MRAELVDVKESIEKFTLSTKIALATDLGPEIANRPPTPLGPLLEA